MNTHKTTKSLVLFALCTLLAGAIAPGLAPTPVAAAGVVAPDGVASSPALGNYLNPDGSLALPEGFRGSLDPGGFSMRYAPDGSPRFVPEAPQAPANTWSALAGGLQGPVYAIAIEGADIYLGGDFTDVGGDGNADRIVRWNMNDQAWHALSSGMDAYVSDIAVVGENVYACGIFTSAGGVADTAYIAQWDGSAWNPLGTGLNNDCYTLEVAGSDLYVGGNFSNAGGIPDTIFIARWDGSYWNAVGPLNYVVQDLTFIGGDLYAGGHFTNAGGDPDADNIARWDGSSWHALGSGLNGNVKHIVSVGNDIYMGGLFTDAGGDPDGDYIARWNLVDESWHSVGGGLNLWVNTLAAIGSDIYAGGYFTDVGGDTTIDYIARWDGSNWRALGSSLNNPVNRIVAEGAQVYVGGYFTDAGGDADADYAAIWDITESDPGWNALGEGLDYSVWALAVQGSDVFAGGSFTDIGGDVNASRIVHWDGNNWQAMGTGVDSTVRSVTVDGPDVYIGGYFTGAGGVPGTGHIARWSTIDNAWHALGTGLSGAVHTITVVGPNVYVGGEFVDAGGDTSADRIAYWDGTTWNPVGSGLPGTVRDIEVVGSDIYVAGYFLDAGGIDDADRIAYWDGTNWYALGTGLNGSAYVLASVGQDMYVGGSFTSAGGVPGTANIARWDGSNWNALDSGLSSAVNDLDVVGSDLIVAGNFLNAGGDGNADCIVRWDGTNWHALIGNPIGFTREVEIVGADLYAVGEFFNAGGNENADYIARWGAVPAQECWFTTAYDYCWEDGFESTDLDPLWTWVREDGAYWSLSENPGSLRITTQVGALDETNNNQNNLLLMRAPDGDFQVTTDVSINPTEYFHNAGLLVYQDDDNFVSVVRGYGSVSPNDKVYFMHEVGGVFEYDYLEESADALYLRITRVGDVYSGSYSLDNSTWIPIGSDTVELSQPMVGIGASSGPSYTEIPADFESFILEGDFPAFENPWQDDFDALTIDPQWWWINEYPDNWDLDVNPGFLSIGTGADGVGDENLLAQKMPPFDFWMETLVAFEPISDFQVAGLATFADGDNYLMFGRAYCDACGGNGIYFDRMEGGSFTGDNFMQGVPETDEATLRVLRQGDTYFGFYRNATSKWLLIGTHTWGGPVDLNTIGITAAAQGSEDYEVADFDYFTVTPGIQPCYLPAMLKP